MLLVGVVPHKQFSGVKAVAHTLLPEKLEALKFTPNAVSTDFGLYGKIAQQLTLGQSNFVNNELPA